VSGAKGYAPPGRVKLQAWIPQELLEELDAVCQSAGRISRRQALEEGWPALLEAVRRRHHVEDPPR
jgi:metal-responsive CopG/Arc/MetJ family transcriptional regulator